MIGKNIRGIHHLVSIANNKPQRILFRLSRSNEIFNGDFILYDSSVLLFNNVYGSEIYTYDDMPKITCQYHRTLIINDETSLFDDKIIEMWVMPESFDKDFNDFLSSNKKMSEIISRKYTNLTNKELQFVYAITNGSKNYFLWAIALRYGNGVDLGIIRQIMKWVDNYGQLSKKLSKGTVTAYTSYSGVLDLLNEIMQLRSEKRVCDVINSFNTTQKKLLKARDLSKKDKETMSLFYKLSSAKKQNFIRKMSTIECADEIMRQMAFLTSVHFDWNKSSFLDYISNTEGINCEVISNNGSIVVLKVNDYDTVKRLGKSTNWCISKNKSYWNQYVGQRYGAIQYIVFDFSKKEDDKYSIVGLTSVFNVGITNAHDFFNDNMMTDNCGAENNMSSFFKVKKNGIINFLNTNGIKISDVTMYEKLPYEWNRESFLNYIYEKVGRKNCDILNDDEDKIAVSIQNVNIYKLLGKTYENNTNYHVWRKRHILFADFNKNENDANKLLFCIVNHKDEFCEDSVDCIFNIFFNRTYFTFNNLIAKYGLPYDIICRPNDIAGRLLNAVYSFDTDEFRSIVSDKKIVNVLKEKRSDITSACADAIRTSIVSRFSSDYVDTIYENGLKIQDFIGKELTSIVFTKVVNCYNNFVEEYSLSLEIPTQEEMDEFYKGNVNDEILSYCYGLFDVLLKMMMNENCDELYTDLINKTYRHNIKNKLNTFIIKTFLQAANLEKLSNVPFINTIVKYSYVNNITELIELINSKLSVDKINKILKNAHVLIHS